MGRVSERRERERRDGPSSQAAAWAVSRRMRIESMRSLVLRSSLARSMDGRERNARRDPLFEEGSEEVVELASGG